MGNHHAGRSTAVDDLGAGGGGPRRGGGGWGVTGEEGVGCGMRELLRNPLPDALYMSENN